MFPISKPKIRIERGVQGMVDELDAGLKYYNARESIMTANERLDFWQALQDKRREYRPVILKALEEDRQDVEKAHRDALANLERARVKEISRWDNEKLLMAFEVTEKRMHYAMQPMLAGPTVPERINALYEEAKASGDMYRQRATFEILQASINTLDGQDREGAVHVIMASQDDLKALHMTPEIEAAQAAETKAREAVQHQAEVAQNVKGLIRLSWQEEHEAEMADIAARNDAMMAALKIPGEAESAEAT